ncbi:hypothetical protein AB1Y20_007987 [Prymnesium parvum]|uniref:Nucleotide-diphospho-sugar transferase domain-containing protein n=1 Tax=Prymnesium parvum TaxID=97485 RepID=A0AB34IU84_PRYPA
MAFRSVGRLAPLPRAALDMAAPGVARQVAETRSYRKELILFTADAEMAGWGFHFVRQLRARGYEHWLILSDGGENCDAMHRKWELVQAATDEPPLSCVYSSYPRAHEGWAQWTSHSRADKMHQVYILWATRWWVALALLREETNVLSLDVDAVLLTDIYQLLRAPPLVQQDVIITRNDDGSQSLNCGFVYFNRDAARSSDRAQRSEVRGRCDGAPGAGGEVAVVEGAVPAAEWVCELMWERLRLFLEIERRELKASPAREVLWEQDAWNDLVKSIELRRRVFPWVTGYGKDSDLWPKLGYRRQVVQGARHAEKWVSWEKAAYEPPVPTPAEGAWAARFAELDLRRPTLWLPLCAPYNRSSRAAVVPPPNTVDGIPLGLQSARPLAHGRIMVAPIWLASLGPDPESDWAGASPSPLAYVHITNMWKCFPHPCWSKAGRLFWLRAHGFWDPRLDELGLTPRGRPFSNATRVLALPPSLPAALLELSDATRALPAFPKPHARLLGFRRLHALIHNLATIAALLARKPVIPQVPCELVRTVQSRELSNTKRSRFGICHAAVVATGPSDAPVCHLTPGTWRPGGPDQCYHNAVMHQFDFHRFTAQPYVRRNGSVAYATPHRAADATRLTYRRGALPLAPLRQLCRRAAALGDVHVLELDGLLPLSDMLVDRPLTAKEFKFETQRIKSKQPRWQSGLRASELAQLADDCPGATQLLAFRKQCVGYFLAE